MIDRRKILIALGASALGLPLTAHAQTKVWRIGFLGTATAASTTNRLDAMRAGLRDLGYIEGKNLTIEFRWGEGNYDRLASLAAELAGLKLDVIVTHGTPGVVAAKNATKTIPIVMAFSGDAIATGLVASLARPGGNVTGSTYFLPELNAKRLELLKEISPRIAQVAVLLNPNNAISRTNLQTMEPAAKSLKLGLQQFKVPGPNEFDSALAAIAKSRVNAIVVTEDGEFSAKASRIADFAIKHRLLSAGSREFAEAGGLIGYGVDLVEMSRRAAYFVDKILKGAKPADIPVEQATRFVLIANGKTAKAIGVKFPQTIVLRIDKVIE